MWCFFWYFVKKTKTQQKMNFLKSFLLVVFTAMAFSLSGQSLLPALKDKAEAYGLISEEVNQLFLKYKSNPTLETERQIALFGKAAILLEQSMNINVGTEYALNSAFVEFEIQYNGAPNDTEAFRRLREKQWSSAFNQLVNLVKK